MKHLTQNNRVEYLDYLRWIAAVAVIFIHIISGAVAIRGNEMNEVQLKLYTTIQALFNWSVPIFVMISGALFLNESKKITINNIILKYIKRIIIVLIIFGVPMNILEYFFKEKIININIIIKSITDIFIGKCWAHMWYLYMIIGLYLVTPVIKKFTDNADKETLKYAIILLGIFNCILPYFNLCTKYSIGIYIPFNSIYLFYYLCGHYIFKYSTDISKVKLKLMIAVAILFIILMCYTKNMSINFVDYSSPVIVILSITFFIYIKNYKNTFRFLPGRDFTFGIYIIHPFFINFVYKYLNIIPYKYNTFMFIISFGLGVLFCSYTCIYILKKIPFIKKYI